MDFDDYPSQSHQSGFPSIMTLSLTALSDLPGDEGGGGTRHGRTSAPGTASSPKASTVRTENVGRGVGGHRLPAPDGGAFPNDAYINS